MEAEFTIIDKQEDRGLNKMNCLDEYDKEDQYQSSLINKSKKRKNSLSFEENSFSRKKPKLLLNETNFDQKIQNEEFQFSGGNENDFIFQLPEFDLTQNNLFENDGERNFDIESEKCERKLKHKSSDILFPTRPRKFIPLKTEDSKFRKLVRTTQRQTLYEKKPLKKEFEPQNSVIENFTQSYTTRSTFNRDGPPQSMPSLYIEEKPQKIILEKNKKEFPDELLAKQLQYHEGHFIRRSHVPFPTNNLHVPHFYGNFPPDFVNPPEFRGGRGLFGGRGRGRGREGTQSLFNLQFIQRDFTSDDYELLLALDENITKNKGATEKQISTLDSQRVSENSKLRDELCVICLEKMEKGTEIRKLFCSHSYHVQCIDIWLKEKSNCPVCSAEVFSQLENENPKIT